MSSDEGSDARPALPVPGGTALRAVPHRSDGGVLRAVAEVRAPVLVLGIGNLLLRDDGVGLTLLELLSERFGADARVELVDGGTQGIALVGLLAGRHGLLVLDAVARNAPPGTVHVIDDAEADAPPRATTAHEGNAGDLLAAATLIGDRPPLVRIVGVEPEIVRTGTGLSEVVTRALPEAVDAAESALRELLAPSIP